MSFDLSRKNFDPLDDYSEVVMQQGRVQVDADWNTMNALNQRRTQAESLDTFGAAVVPMETPDGFLISGAPTAFEIGPGRIYVDGLLAENHTEVLKWDARLAEISGTAKLSGADVDAAPSGPAGTTSYQAQPYLKLPLDTPPDGPFLVYLDAWQRDITYLQDESLVDVAVAVDTTARRQTVWQVKFLQGVGDVDGATDELEIPGWLKTIHPSSARLSTATGDLLDDENPCLLPRQAGYKGLENQLYRVQVHQGGKFGQATFKWSRDNAVVSSRVSKISGNEIVVDSLGRDDVLGFHAGDWVEITDDYRDFKGMAGELRRIQLLDGIDTATRTITLEGLALPTGSANGNFSVDADDQTIPDRNTRVIRWDQEGIVFREDENEHTDLDANTSTGAIEIPAGGPGGIRLFLEKGVLVEFNLEDLVDEAVSDPKIEAEFKVGDYWIFPARVNDASIEELESAPPMGIHHHYAKLAIFDGDEFIDCRKLWPPSDCCTITVRPGESIQAAIDSLGSDGGCICIKTGLHEIKKPLRIEHSNIVIHGESAAAVIRRINGVSVLVIRSPSGEQLRDVVIHGLRLESAGEVNIDDARIIVFADRCKNLRLQDCVMTLDQFSFVVAVRIDDTDGGVIERCEIGPVGIGVWVTGESTELAILDNRLNGAFIDRRDSVGGPFFDSYDAGSIGIWLEQTWGPSRVERNTIRGFQSGINVNSAAHGSTIIGNQIVRNASIGVGFRGQYIFGIEFAASAGLVSDNTLSYRSEAYSGIRVTGRNVCIDNNHLSSEFTAWPSTQIPIGIQLGSLEEITIGPGEGGVIRNNRLSGCQHAIVVLGADRAKIICNRIDGGELAVDFGVFAASADNIVVADNEILQKAIAVALVEGIDCTVSGNQADGGLLGILASDQTDLSIHGNRIRNQDQGGMLLSVLFGTTTIIENRVVSCGSKGIEGIGAFGILVAGAVGNVHIESCKVIDTGHTADQTREDLLPAYGIWGFFVLECLVQGNEVTYGFQAIEHSQRRTKDRALLLLGILDLEINNGVLSGNIESKFRFGWPAQVVDNKFTGPGTHLVEFQEIDLSRQVQPGTVVVSQPRSNFFIRFERVTFSNNYCWHWIDPKVRDSDATVLLHGHSAIVIGNHVKPLSFSRQPPPPFNFNDMQGIYMGNAALGPAIVNSQVKPAPQDAFNH